MVNIDQHANLYGDKMSPVDSRLPVFCARLIGQGVYTMPGSHSVPTGPSLSSIECPRCPHCQGRMTLESIAPAPPGYDLRTFECARCDRISTKLVPSDPMKTGDATRWLGSELKAPD
jgi:hypothetical protein